MDFYYTKSCDVYTDNNTKVYVMLTGKLNAASKCHVSDLRDYRFTIHYGSIAENAIADALFRPNKLLEGRGEEEQFTIPPKGFSSILSASDNNFKEKSVWIATLTVTGVLDQIEYKFLYLET